MLTRSVQPMGGTPYVSRDKFDKSFTDQGSLQRHVKSEHQKIQYSCDKCDKSFTDQGNLQRHVKS